MDQYKYDIPMMKTAIVWSDMSKCTRGKVGAVIAKENNIISVGYNGTPTGYISNGDFDCEEIIDGELKTDHDRVLHAEQNALMYAARMGHSTKDATIYVTTSPCSKCAILIAQAGIKRVVYFNEYRNLDGIKKLNQLNIIVDSIKF